MSKRRIQSLPAKPSRPFRGRRLHQRRTPEDNVRVSAAWVVERTLSTLSPSSVFLDSALARCDELDHRLLRELSLGTLRWLRRLDHVIALASHRRFEEIEPALRAPLRVAAYQLLFMDRIPAHAAVNEGVEHARRLTHRGGASFTNGVLRRIARAPRLDAWPVEEADPCRRLAIEKSHPDFLAERWIERFGEHGGKALLEANNRPKSLQLLAFRDLGGRELLAETLIDEGVDLEPSAIAPMGLTVRSGNPLHSEAFRRGEFYIQDEASQASALVPRPRPGERVFDAAAAPGGKSFTLLAVEPSSKVVMADVSPARLFTVRRNLERLRRSVPVIAADAGRPPTQRAFDRVILDLPCTGTGTLRKSPELKWRISEAEIGRLSRQSLRLLEGMAPLVAPEGFLIAITCSLEPEENEAVVETFLERHGEFSLLPLEDQVDYPLAGWIAGPGCWRMLPEGDHDGFTVHALVRRRQGVALAGAEKSVSSTPRERPEDSLNRLEMAWVGFSY
ncbi:MAG: hypothetical protein GY719_26770 [bacterium]|nr:hypothetical protein [bacterium]